MKKIIEFLKKVLAVLKKAFWNKTMLHTLIGAILGALAMTIPDEVLDKFICSLPFVSGCEVTAESTPTK